MAGLFLSHGPFNWVSQLCSADGEQESHGVLHLGRQGPETPPIQKTSELGVDPEKQAAIDLLKNESASVAVRKATLPEPVIQR